MGKKKSGPDYKREAISHLLAQGSQNVKAEVGPNGRTVYTVVGPEERPVVDPVEAEKVTTDPTKTPEQVKAWFNEPDRHTVFGKQQDPHQFTVGVLVPDRCFHCSAPEDAKIHQVDENEEAPVAVYRDEDEKNEYGRKKLNELHEMQLRWAEEVKRMGLADNPGSLMADTVDTVIEMGRVISESEAAEAAYDHQDFRCIVMMVGATPEPGSIDARIADLREWWIKKAADDVSMVAEKAVTYGSNSLEQLGRKMAQLNGRRDISSEEAQELGCWVYLTGKAERWTDAVMRGERPKDDTILDIAMYATMAARIRNAGGWPDSQG